MCVEQDHYPVCCSTDEQTKKNYVKYRKVRVNTDLIVDVRYKQEIGLTYEITRLVTTLAPASGNEKSHLKNKITVIFSHIQTNFAEHKTSEATELSKTFFRNRVAIQKSDFQKT